VWGQIPMPGMPQLAADEVKTMVTWILALPAKK
jgi:cytochrome c551/c552